MQNSITVCAGLHQCASVSRRASVGKKTASQPLYCRYRKFRADNEAPLIWRCYAWPAPACQTQSDTCSHAQPGCMLRAWRRTRCAACQRRGLVIDVCWIDEYLGLCVWTGASEAWLERIISHDSFVLLSYTNIVLLPSVCAHPTRTTLTPSHLAFCGRDM
jgi:hypothetical protein